jgi:hypothetical protein
MMRFLSMAMLAGFLLIPCGSVAATGPRISFEKEAHDYGKVFSGDSVTYEFVVTNTGDETLVLQKLEPSCGCVETVKGSTEIAPKGTTKIVVAFDTKGLKPGRKKQSVHVYSNDPTKPSTKITLYADVVREIVVDPLSLNKKLKNSVKKVSFPLKITNASSRACTLTGIRSQGSDPKAELTPGTIVVEPRAIVSFTIEIELPPKSERLIYMGRLALLTDHPREKEIEISYLIQLDK